MYVTFLFNIFQSMHPVKTTQYTDDLNTTRTT